MKNEFPVFNAAPYRISLVLQSVLCFNFVKKDADSAISDLFLDSASGALAAPMVSDRHLPVIVREWCKIDRTS